MMWRLAACGIALAISVYCGNLALFNWWASGVPPMLNPELYRFRGHLFFFLACLFLALAIVLAITTARRWRGR